MADLNKVGADRQIVAAGSMGNASVEISKHNTIGVLVAGTDRYFVAKIPKGAIITDVELNAFLGLSAATGTLDIGYSMDGVDAAKYFVDAFDSAGGGKSPRNLGAPLECTEDCYIIATPLTANTVADKLMTVVISYEYQGQV